MKKQLLVGLFSFSTALQPLLAEKLITDSPITVNQERLQAKKNLRNSIRCYWYTCNRCQCDGKRYHQWNDY